MTLIYLIGLSLAFLFFGLAAFVPRRKDDPNKGHGRGGYWDHP